METARSLRYNWSGLAAGMPLAGSWLLAGRDFLDEVRGPHIDCCRCCPRAPTNSACVRREVMAQLSGHDGRSSEGRTSNRGFASMNADRQRQIASMGGKAVPDEKRSFSQNRRLAAEAGRKGGQSVPGSKRSFSQNRELAATAGRKGGQASHGGGTRPS